MYQLLAMSYFMAFVAAVLKACRYWMDYKRTGHRFYLVGVPANLTLATALALIVVASGNDPLWSGPALAIAIRTTIILWALLSFLFQILYGRTYLVVTPTTPSEEMDVETHGD